MIIIRKSNKSYRRLVDLQFERGRLLAPVNRSILRLGSPKNCLLRRQPSYADILSVDALMDAASATVCHGLLGLVIRLNRALPTQFHSKANPTEVGLPLAFWSLPRVFSQKFLQQLKTTLFGRAGFGSASE